MKVISNTHSDSDDFSFNSSAQKKVKNRGGEGGEGEIEEEEELTPTGCINRTTSTLKPTTTFNLDLLFGTPPSTRKPITRKSCQRIHLGIDHTQNKTVKHAVYG